MLCAPVLSDLPCVHPLPQENVKRVQLADAYMKGAELEGTDGSSLPEAYQGLRRVKNSLLG